jgi:hypothetical protein
MKTIASILCPKIAVIKSWVCHRCRIIPLWTFVFFVFAVVGVLYLLYEFYGLLVVRVYIPYYIQRHLSTPDGFLS